MREWWEDEGSSSSTVKAANLPPCKSYTLDLTQINWARQFTAEEKKLLRPIAETLAMLDGNAFFSHQLADGAEWYEQYLHEAHALMESNGGQKGWIVETSWVKDMQHENISVEQAYNSWRAAKMLSKP